MSVASVVTDEQGNILVHGVKALEINTTDTPTVTMNKGMGLATGGGLGMKKSHSAVFSWPSFVTHSHISDVVVPFKNVVQVRSTDTVRSVLWTLIKNKVECVPVYNEASKKYVGFVDMFDLVQYIASAAGPSVVKPDFFQVFKRQPFGDTQISKILNSASKDHCTSATESAPLSALFELTVSTNLPHVPVMAKQRVLGMVSQAKLVQFLVKNKANFSELASKTLSELDISGTDNVYTVEDTTPSVTAFVYMAEKGVRGLAVVNKDGQIVDAIHSFDIKGLVHGDFFSDLRQPVLHYLSKARILLGRNLAPVVCTPEDTLAVVLEKMAQEKIYRVFIMDTDRKPICVISLRDILKAMHSFTPSTKPSLAGSGGQ